MKKQLLLFALILTSFASIGQAIVTTTVENKKVILEEFTGIYCVYCPQGHAIAQAIQDNNPGEAFLINIHYVFQSINVSVCLQCYYLKLYQ